MITIADKLKKSSRGWRIFFITLYETGFAVDAANGLHIGLAWIC